MLNSKMANLRDLWEETSFQLERRQCNADCVDEERLGLRHRRAPAFNLTFDPAPCYEAGGLDAPGENISVDDVEMITFVWVLF